MMQPPGAPPLGVADLERLLARPLIQVDMDRQRRVVAGRSVLITGAGGSIGAELVRAVAVAGARRIVMLDSSEHGLFWVDESIRQIAGSHMTGLSYRSVMGSICDRALVDELLSEERPDLLLHAAACKHVDLVERNPLAGIETNLLGTAHLLRSARRSGVRRFLLVSTDKAVQPTSVMGATKRAAEHLVRASADPTHKFASVRFGNVLGSSGSVLQLFISRLRAGLPLEIRHPDACRFFLAGTEAAGLLIVAAGAAEAGDILVLKTGAPRRILDLATSLIQLLGPGLPGGIVPSPPTRTTALRPGERVEERLCAGEPTTATDHPCVARLQERARDPSEISVLMDELATACRERRTDAALRILGRLVPGYRPGRSRS